MRALIQRVTKARVTVGDEEVGAIGRGLVVLLGAGRGDEPTVAEKLARKTVELRIFADEADKMNRSLLETGGECLVVSQFTLYADCTRGRRPYFGDAEEPARAQALCQDFVAALRSFGITVATGRFGAMMSVELVNDGPVTVWLDSASL